MAKEETYTASTVRCGTHTTLSQQWSQQQYVMGKIVCQERKKNASGVFYLGITASVGFYLELLALKVTTDPCLRLMDIVGFASQRSTAQRR